MTLTSPPSSAAAARGWFTEDDCDLDEFETLVAQQTQLADYPHAQAVAENVLIYDSERLRGLLGVPADRRAVAAELARAMMAGPGLVVLKNAVPNHDVIDQASELFFTIISEQHASGAVAGDHFAKPGANDRIWNTLEKLAVRAPQVFARYYANEILDLVCRAWLGPYYQVTSTINVVNPGGAPQTGHRDYHLGFLSNDVAGQFPAHAHLLSPVLTLQGAVAHCDMPLETGPTTYLPYSQLYPPGYLAWRQPWFLAYFEAHQVQLPLEKGDAAFFNPALLHAAGHNRSTDVKRMANLLQVSSAFGRAMESVDRERMCLALFPTLLELRRGGLGDASLQAAVAACAEGYAFPTNLDLDQPVGGLVPDTQAVLVWRAVTESWEPAALSEALAAYSARRRTVS